MNTQKVHRHTMCAGTEEVLDALSEVCGTNKEPGGVSAHNKDLLSVQGGI